MGARSTLQWYLIRVCQTLGIRTPKSWRVRPRQVQHALTARLRGSSDMKVFWQIFNFEEYSTLRGMVNVFLILDLGANVGYSSAYFLSCFPDARSIAVEPDEQNVAICRMNLEPYDGRALVLTGAVWSQAGLLSLSKVTSGDGLECARMVAQPQEGSLGNVRAWNVGDLIDISGCTAVDLLKVDIEGAELEVFGASARAWLHRVRNICIELHGPDCERTFFKAVAGFNYELERSGELTICRNLHPKLAADTN